MGLLTIGRHARVIVTGGAGFIGTRLSRRLMADGATVTVLTRHVDSPNARALAAAGATLIPGDLAADLSPATVAALPTGAHLFHFAASTAVDGPGVRGANVDGTRRALDLAARLNASQVLFASSIEAQGLSADAGARLSESDPCHPVSPYGRSKLEAESLVAEWSARSGTKAVALRIGNTYGPGSAWLVQSALLLCFGKGSLHPVWPALRHRAFQPLYVDDLVDAVVRVAALPGSGLFNVTGGTTVTFEDYLTTLAGLLGVCEPMRALWQREPSVSSAAASVAPDFAYFLMGDEARCHRVYDNGALEAAIGPYVRWSLPRGLAATLAWYRDSGPWQALVQSRRMQGSELCMSH